MAQPLVRRRVAIAADAFVEVVICEVPAPISPSTRPFQYQLAYSVDDRCVLRYDNEPGKGGHRHWETTQEPCVFVTPDRLMSDFEADVAKWNHENRHS
jgi:Family of unknown function (DUF6516)